MLMTMMLNVVPLQTLLMCLSVLVSGQTQTEESSLSDRVYELLQKQNLVMLGSVLSVLLLLMVVMSVCVYKPLARR